MKIELTVQQLNVITAALRGHQSAVEIVLQDIQLQVNAAAQPTPPQTQEVARASGV